MNLSADERQSLVGPAVVGCLFGLLAALATVAFHSEYGYPPGTAAGWTNLLIAGGLAFASIAGGCFLVFGVAPVALSRIPLRKKSRGNA